VPWPTDGWPESEAAAVGGDGQRLTELVDELFADEEHPVLGRTYGLAVVAGGRLVAERYGRRVVQDLRSLAPDPPFDDVTADTGLLSWSMAKSLSHLALGIAIADGKVALTDPVAEPQWADADDPRHAIGWDDLLTMRSGLQWLEEYVLDGDVMPDVVEMLVGAGADDMAAFAAGFPLVAEPGNPASYNYSSGTTNIVVANLQRVLGLDGPGVLAFLQDRIFSPLGMASAVAALDPAGTFVGSSTVHATLRDWCRFGLLALRGGHWDGVDLVPPTWMDHGRTGRSWDETIFHGAHWWTWDTDDVPFGAHGFEGQRVIAFPTRDVVLVRLGKSSEDASPALNDHLTAMAACFPTV
jgi:CubicO group peptidase (beta-lactamase class C family)